MNAADLIAQTLDHGTYVSWDVAPPTPLDPDYAATLERASARADQDEAVITGEGTVDGHRVCVIVGEFAYLGGSIGVATAERITAAVRRATVEGLPLLAAPVSGGTRMQEGTRAFVQMVAIAAAVADHKAAGLAYLVYLRNPTTGGVFASWASMGHVTAAEPGAMVGFLGPRVYEALEGHEFPAGVQTAENLHAHGLIDAVIGTAHLRTLIVNALEILGARAPNSPPTPETAVKPLEVDDWEVVLRSRAPGRPGSRALIHHASTTYIPLSGTGRGDADPTVSLGLALVGGQGVAVLAQDKVAQTGTTRLGPGALRVVTRGIALAEELSLPLVTIIDTPGAALTPDAEEGGLAGQISRTLTGLVRAHVPVVCVLWGQGTGGAALAMLPADRVLAADHSWLAPLPPEGASALRYRTTDRAAEVARDQRVAAWHLHEDGIVDEVVECSAPDGGIEAMRRHLMCAISALTSIPTADLVANRTKRFERVAVASRQPGS
ncbi:carboxyl transferase domain-containing protein [Demequina aurantiaca]|uniref:carboxyl transferase domain-containing protein n=1 Tax=Demequina aurantiaca TaxID=676200 RepID=UPI000781061F|nr:carboxyl transferase domain-containing protein [Demequina aurantiaca]